MTDATAVLSKATIDTPARKTIPSWYPVSKEDHALNPDLEHKALYPRCY